MGVIEESKRNMKPCPLCGGRAEFKIGEASRDTSQWHTIRCTQCGCSISWNESGYSPSYEKDLLAFFRKWNERQTQTQETYAGYTLDQLQEVAAVLKGCNMQPADLGAAWKNFVAVVAAVQSATDKKWQDRVRDMLGKLEG